MKKPLIVGNWKMNRLISEAVALARDLRKGIENIQGVTVVIAPPFTALKQVAEVIEGSSIRLSAQNLHEATEGRGAFTGEISAPMLIDAGCTYCIVGHSERRHLFGETDERVRLKVKTALEYDLIPILCLGETLVQRDRKETFSVIERQLIEGLKNIPADDIRRTVIAYEPVWAIGTGKTALPAQAEEAHRFVRELVADKYGSRLATTLPVIYGGSVNQDNISGLMAQDNIDGALVGGASLDSGTFLQIVDGLITNPGASVR